MKVIPIGRLLGALAPVRPARCAGARQVQYPRSPARPRARQVQAAVRSEVLLAMVIDVSNTTLWAAVLALVIGVLILIVPRILNYLVAVYLIIIGILGLIPFFGG
jgi:hypothetical protein